MKGKKDMSSAKKALVINDNPEISLILSKALAQAGYWSIHADNGSDAAKILNGGEPDAVIINLAMANPPAVEADTGISGAFVLKIVGTPNDGAVRILINGGNECLTHAIPVPLLGKQIGVLLKEWAPRLPQGKIACERLLYNPGERTAEYGDKTVRFTRSENELLHTLIENKGLLVPYDKLGPQNGSQLSKKGVHRVNVHIAAVRKKLKELTGKVYIKSMHDAGYIFCEVKKIKA